MFFRRKKDKTPKDKRPKDRGDHEPIIENKVPKSQHEPVLVPPKKQQKSVTSKKPSRSKTRENVSVKSHKIPKSEFRSKTPSSSGSHINEKTPGHKIPKDKIRKKKPPQSSKFKNTVRAENRKVQKIPKESTKTPHQDNFDNPKITKSKTIPEEPRRKVRKKKLRRSGVSDPKKVKNKSLKRLKKKHKRRKPRKTVIHEAERVDNKKIKEKKPRREKQRKAPATKELTEKYSEEPQTKTPKDKIPREKRPR